VTELETYVTPRNTLFYILFILSFTQLLQVSALYHAKLDITPKLVGAMSKTVQTKYKIVHLLVLHKFLAILLSKFLPFPMLSVQIHIIGRGYINITSNNFLKSNWRMIT
jgi:hypothetical protein